jgi:plasmid stabilization system protein ParE
MIRNIIFSQTALNNLARIDNYQFRKYGIQNADIVSTAIEARIIEIGQQAYRFTKIPGLDASFRGTVVEKYPYKVYSKVIDNYNVKIIMVRHTSQKPPTPDQLKQASRN